MCKADTRGGFDTHDVPAALYRRTIKDTHLIIQDPPTPPTRYVRSFFFAPFTFSLPPSLPA